MIKKPKGLFTGCDAETFGYFFKSRKIVKFLSINLSSIKKLIKLYEFLLGSFFSVSDMFCKYRIHV